MPLETTAQSPAPVRQIATLIDGWINRLGAVWVEGQIAQISRRPGLNTVFMTMRDPIADISIGVTCSRTLFDGLNPPLVEGASVVVNAKPSYYANRGTLSLAAREIRMVGLGELLARIERRRQLLAAEGLFAAELKRALPFLPGCVGLVTAPSSAAERDVLENARRRWPAVAFEVAHAAMQGTRAAAEVIEAVERLDRDPRVDVIVVARGGGSVEDLLPFSDEGLVRAGPRRSARRSCPRSATSPTLPCSTWSPTSAPSTPTDAAKLVVPDVLEERQHVAAARDRIRSVVTGFLAREQAGLDNLRSRPVLADPRSLVAARTDEIGQLRERARRCLRHGLDRGADDIAHHRARAGALSPLETLRRGYSVLQDADGHVVSSVAGVATGAPVAIRVSDGRIHATTTKVEVR